MAAGFAALETPYGRVAYRKMGNGPICLIGLHGFAQDHRLFLPAIRHIDLEAYTCYWVDLPFHGATEWGRHRFTLGELRAVLQMLVRDRPYEGVGHSLGGRLWIHLLPTLGEAPRHLHLLAPDGFGSLWSGVTEGTPAPIRSRLERMLQHPQRFLKMAAWLQRVGGIDRFTLRYLQKHLESPAARKRLFCTWNSLAALPMDRNTARGILADAGCPVSVTLGAQDFVIPNAKVAAALKPLGNVRLQEFPYGHWSLARHWRHR